MRVPLITPLAARDGTVEKDERLVNCFGEQDIETKTTMVIKRAGIDEGDAVISGNDIYGQGLFNYDGYLFAMIDDTLGYWVYVGGGTMYGGGGGTYFNEQLTEYDTFNPTSPYLVYGSLSNGNLTYTLNHTTLEYGAWSTLTKTSDKWYVEGTLDSLASGSVAVIGASGGQSAFLTTADVGAVIGLAIHAGSVSNTITVYKNGAVDGVWSSDVSVAIKCGINKTGSITMNFGATPFVYAVPAGHNSGWY